MMSGVGSEPYRNNACSRLVWFGAWWMVIGLVWLVILPRWSGQPNLRARIDRLDANGIDPSALFYTDLDYRPANGEGVESHE